MAYYKFLRTEDLHFILSEKTLAISSPSYFSSNYATMEREDSWINDPYETAIVGSHDPLYIEDAATASALERETMEALGIYFEPGVSVKGLTLKNNTTVTLDRSVFIFSLARGYFPDLRAALANATTGYDACVRIRRPHELWREILKTGQIESRPAATIFSSVQWGRVSYGDGYAQYHIGHEEKPQSLGPFAKTSKHSNQCEWRVVLNARETGLRDRLYVKFDGLLDYVSVKSMD